MTQTQLTFKVTEPFAIRQPNGKVHEYKKGRVLSLDSYTALSEQFKPFCKAVSQGKPVGEVKNLRQTKSPWTTAEYENLLGLYLEHVRPDGTADHTLIATLHCEVFPTRSHSGAHMAVDQIRAHDSHVPQTGLESASVPLLGVLADADPERFWVAVELLFEKVA